MTPAFMVPEPVVALGVCAKAALVLLAACGAAACLRRSAAATRHRVWTLATAVALGLVMASPLAPRIPVRVPIHLAPDRGFTIAGILLGLRVLSQLWLLGAIAVGSWFLVGHLTLARLSFRARRSTLRHPPDDPVAQALRERGARVLWSADVDVPLTGGVLRPVLLIPTAARGWPARRLRAALRHELAHVARRDLLAQALGAALCVVFWFNPLAWYAFHRMRVESELACDDHVLLSGSDAAEYATHLLAVARSVRRTRAFATAAGMVSSADLEGRVRAILDPGRARAGGRRAGAALAIVSLLILLPLASLRTQLAPRFDSAPPTGIPPSPPPRSLVP